MQLLNPPAPLSPPLRACYHSRNESPEALPRNDHPELPHGAAQPGFAAGGASGVTEEWSDHRHEYDLSVSDLVLDEAGEGDAVFVASRLARRAGFPGTPKNHYHSSGTP